MSGRKRAGSLLLFALILVLTYWTLFSKQDLGQVWGAVRTMNPLLLLPALGAALAFVALEGTMIWIMLRKAGESISLGRCVVYSFVGFFYSAITPSATGGQPVQLYYMKRDRLDLAKCSLTLMTVAFLYKLALVVVGAFMLVFWLSPLRQYMRQYFALFLLGLVLNLVVIALLLAVMRRPGWIRGLGQGCIRLLRGVHLLPADGAAETRLDGFVHQYGRVARFFGRQKALLVGLFLLTLVQRSTLFFLTYAVYRGLGLHETGAVTVILLQASVYIAVDMLPVPGAQGVTELVYQTVFATVFGSALLVPSLLVSHGANFYFPLVVSAVVLLAEKAWNRRCRRWN